VNRAVSRACTCSPTFKLQSAVSILLDVMPFPTIEFSVVPGSSSDPMATVAAPLGFSGSIELFVVEMTSVEAASICATCSQRRSREEESEDLVFVALDV